MPDFDDDIFFPRRVSFHAIGLQYELSCFFHDACHVMLSVCNTSFLALGTRDELFVFVSKDVGPRY